MNTRVPIGLLLLSLASTGPALAEDAWSVAESAAVSEWKNGEGRNYGKSMEKALVKPATNMAVCLEGRMKGWKTLPPPHGGFWAKLDLNLKAK